MSISSIRIYTRKEDSTEFRNTIHRVSTNILMLNKIQMQFIIYESRNSNFYKNGNSSYIKKYNKLFETISEDLRSLHHRDLGVSMKKDLLIISQKLEEYKKEYELLLHKIKVRGFWDNGLEGNMRRFIHEVEGYDPAINMTLLLTVRRNEKDYILRKDSSYITKLQTNITRLRKNINTEKKLSAQSKQLILKLLAQYETTFLEYVKIDSEIGLDQGGGLTKKLKLENEFLENVISKILKQAGELEIAESRNNKIIFSITATLAVVLSIILSFYLSSVLTKPIRDLSEAISESVRSNFEKRKHIENKGQQDEIGNLITSFNWLLDRVQLYVKEIKQNEIMLYEKDKRFRALLENSNDAIVLTDIHGNILYASPSTKRLIGYDPESIITRSAIEMAHPEDRYLLQKQFTRVLSMHASIVHLEFRIMDQDGKWRWLDGYAANYLHDEGINGIIINYHDVTSRKNHELKIHEQNIELKKINTELDRFVYSASHDLKAPLTSILGIINVARIEPNPGMFPRYLEMTEISVKKLMKIINDMTEFSRNARTDIEREEINFSKIIEDALDSYSHLENFNKINIMTRISGTRNFYSDRLRIKTLLNNLISNSIIYHNTTQEKPEINITVFISDKGADIEIEDNGQGIEKSYQSKIFDMFYRASDDSKGSGLGLFIAKEIITKLKGKITLHSEAGKGTKFLIFLPGLTIITNGTRIKTEEYMVC